MAAFIICQSVVNILLAALAGEPQAAYTVTSDYVEETGSKLS